ncbi:M-phase inducer phosphatase isoform X2 [Drosophila elegans]|uniref:M-phase inducer phosphatase isoform X2 n=1 Tax=Drosophila elegans TaxID=30023 RepID=UPI0007E89642|nr:M-phase inducer phosphatase isoform X2 [Drosophila elegans]
MFCINNAMIAFFLATTLCSGFSGLTQAQLLDEDDDLAFGRPWPTYSLQNMPKTQFTCSDKILGGYYADPETQCQMFHVCVKLPGVGVQDYRFLCPNTTAFDQELQICANWVDVDCDKATSFYDHGHLNDLYRAGDESKSTHEEEPTFHLQRAETGDVRRSKENHNSNNSNNRGGEQKSRPRHNYAQTGSSSSSSSNPNLEITQSTKRPISTYYTPTTLASSPKTTTTTTTATSTTERNNNYYSNNYSNNYNNNDDSKQDIDDIFKGSHSSHFFSNRHGGREYDEEPSPSRAKPNDFSDYQSRKITPTRGGQRSTSPITTSTAAPGTTKSLKKITLHATFNTDFLDKTSSNNGVTTSRPSSSITSRFSFGSSDFATQEKIQPTTYNPNNGAYRFKTTTSPASQQSSTKVTGKGVQDFEKRSKPTTSAVRKQKLGPQESNYINQNEFVEVSKMPRPQPFQVQVSQNKPIQLEPHYQRHKPQVGRVGNQEPAPFSAPSSSKPRSFTSRGSITYKATTERYADQELYYPTTSATSRAKEAYTPTTFRPTTYKKPYEQSYQTQLTHRPTTQGVFKKATTSATAPPPTTANPNVDENDGQYHPELYENDFPRNRIRFLRNRSTSSTSTTTTSAPVAASRQPHGFYVKQSNNQKERERERERDRDSDLSDEEELFNTAQSLNFGAASINKLRADIYKAEKTSQQYNSQYSPQLAASSPQASSSSTTSTTTSTTSTTTSTTTRRPTTTARTTTTVTTSAPPKQVDAKKSVKSKKEQLQLEKKERPGGKRPPYADEDTSYDYAYYDTD